MSASLSTVGTPNRSILPIDFKCGKKSIDVDYEKLKVFAKEWRKHLELLGNNVEAVKPGFIVLGTAITNKGLYHFVSGIPIRSKPIEVGTKAWTRIRIPTSKELDTPIDIFKQEVEQLLNKTNINIQPLTIYNKEIDVIPKVNVQSSWSPGYIVEGSGPGYTLFWIQQQSPQPIIKLNTKIPIATIYLYGSPNDIAKVNNVKLSITIRVESRAGITIGVTFTGGAAIFGSVQGEIRYKMGTYTFTLSENYQYLGLTFGEIPIRYGNVPTVYGIGIYGDFAIARYRLHYCASAGYVFYCGYLDTYADVFLVRPYVVNNRINGWSEVDVNLNDDEGLSEAHFWIRNNYVKGPQTITSTSFIYIKDFDVMLWEGGLPIQFLVGISLECSLKYHKINLGTFRALIATVIGYDREESTISVVTAEVTLLRDYWNKNVYLIANYYVNPNLYEFNGNYYRVPTIFTDVFVYTS